MGAFRGQRSGWLTALGASVMAAAAVAPSAPAAAFTGMPTGTVRAPVAQDLSFSADTVDPLGTAHLKGTSCSVFPADNYWNTSVKNLPVHPKSATWIAHMHPSSRLHPDFGPSYGDLPVPYGIPITIVTGAHKKHRVAFSYASESDRVKYPLGSDTKIEGGPGASGDRHAIVVNKTSCRVFETFATRKTSGKWKAGSGATWSLKRNDLRPKGWTSADAAGLPILPGLLRLDEVTAGRVAHAIRFTTDVTDRSFVWPARHQAGSVSSAAYPPMGARFRLKAGFSTDGFHKNTRVVLKAMKRYGLVLADNGSPWYFQGTSEKGWGHTLLDELKTIPASAFQAVDTSSMKVSANSAAAGG